MAADADGYLHLTPVVMKIGDNGELIPVRLSNGDHDCDDTVQLSIPQEDVKGPLLTEARDYLAPFIRKAE
jgi:hypothetical protein